MPAVLAHNVGAGSLPAPAWLLGYLGALAVLGTAVALRNGWTTSRFAVTAPDEVAASTTPIADRWGLLGRILAVVLRILGLGLLGLTVAAAIIGPDSAAENVAPVAVFVVWWVGLPLLCLVLGDVMRAINPFDSVVALLERITGRSGERTGAPTWTAAAFLWAFQWVFLAYHRPGSPRVVAVLLVVYTVAAIAGGLHWGRAWLATGEGFGGLSAGLARLTHHRGSRPPGLLAIVVVWLGATAFDGVSSTRFWIDVLGRNTGWHRTFLNTVGLVWMTAIVAAVALLVLRITDDEADDDGGPLRRRSLVVLLGVALLPVATGWFIAHDITLGLLEGQNFKVLVSDPLGRGWDLFGTISDDIDFKLPQAGWVRWVQLGALLAGHVGAVVLAHDGAIARLGRRRGMRVTWTVAVAAAGSVVAAALLVLG